MTDSDVQEIDFESWSKLAREDPDAFEARRNRVIGEFLASAAPAQQPRLRGLQWRIDQVRRQARSPMAACVRLSSMMWDSVVGDEGLLQSLQCLSDESAARDADRAKADVLPFKRPDNER